MAEGRGKRAKKTKWQIDLGPKEMVFAGLGVAGLLMMCFALGTLAGRGDIYRVLCNWGLLGPENLKTVALAPGGGLAPNPVPATVLAQPQEGVTNAGSSPQVQAQKDLPGPVTGAITPPAAPAHAAKKKAGLKEIRKNEDEVKEIKKKVASKLKFLNKQDQPTAKTGTGDKSKAKDKTASKGAPELVFVAKYRDGKRAQAKVAEMRKQGDQVFLKEGKDGEGPYFAIYRRLPGTPAPTKPPVVALQQTKTAKSPQKSTKSAVPH